MAPSANDIKSLLESAIHSQLTKPKEALASQSVYEFGNFADHFSDEIHFRIAGHPDEFALALETKGLHGFKQLLNTVSGRTLGSLIDTNKPITSEVVRVIGGGDSEWAAAILRESATSVKSEPFFNLNNPWPDLTNNNR